MNAELRDKWVAALQSGDYIQGQGALRAPGPSGDTYCCLGVLCDLVAPDRWDLWDIDAYAHDGALGLPSVDFMLAHELELERIHFLAKQNDNGATFKWIATYIENVWPTTESISGETHQAVTT